MENIESITEEKEVKKPFYSYRGVAACFSAGISFVTDNFLFLLKVFAPVLCLQAVVATAYNIAFFSVSSGFGSYNISMICVSCLFALFNFICMCASAAMMYRLMLQESLGKGFLGYNSLTLLKASRKQFTRLCLFLIILVAISLICFIPSIGLLAYIMPKGIEPMSSAMVNVKMLYAVAVIVLNLVVVLFVLYIPAELVLTYVTFSLGNVFKNFWQGYKKAYKIWGKCFGLSILLSITIGIIALLLTFPGTVMVSIRTNAMVSESIGDKADLPGSFMYFYALAFFLMNIVTSFISLIVYTSFSYLYAAMKHDEKEKESWITEQAAAGQNK